MIVHIAVGCAVTLAGLALLASCFNDVRFNRFKRATESDILDLVSGGLDVAVLTEDNARRLDRHQRAWANQHAFDKLTLERQNIQQEKVEALTHSQAAVTEIFEHLLSTGKGKVVQSRRRAVRRTVSRKVKRGGKR